MGVKNRLLIILIRIKNVTYNAIAKRGHGIEAKKSNIKPKAHLKTAPTALAIVEFALFYCIYIFYDGQIK